MKKKTNFRAKLRLFRVLIFTLLFIIISGSLLIILGYMEDSVEGRGVVQGLREYQLRSTVRSHVVSISCKEGKKVKKGDELLRLYDRDLQEKIATLKNSISELAAEIKVKEAEFEVLKRDPLPKHYRHNSIELAEYKTRLEKSKYELEVYKELLKKQVISRMKYQHKELEHLRNSAELKKITDDYKRLQSGLGAKILGKAQNELSLLKLKLVGKKQQLELMKMHSSDYIITAPEDGLVSYIPNKPGGYVEPGDILVKLAGGGKKRFTVYVDEKYIYKIREGQKVRISSSQYNYFDYGYFEGKVYRIDELPITRGSINYYPVKVLLTKEPQPLRLGSTGEAEIITGRERIIYGLAGWRH
jgi:multidrug resistance efflux pump